MKYLSVCSGIEAATVAWHHMGWQPTAFSEIEKFPSEVLSHHYPNVPNFGDMTKYKEWQLNESVGLLVGGTPCQSFSVAGLRKGLEDPRGNLMLTYLGIADHFKPKWILWENVKGVLSSNGGKDFACFLQGLAELGYGFAYRILDAQHFGVPQRRKRVFVVGCLADWRSAAKVLFESESLCGDITPSRSKGKDTSKNFIPSIANTIQTTCNDYSRADGFNMIAYDSIALAENTIGRKPENGGNGNGFTEGGPMYTLNATGVHGVMSFAPSHFLRGFGQGVQGNEAIGTLKANHNDSVAHVCYEWHNQDSRVKEINVAATLNCNAGGREGHLIQSLSHDSVIGKNLDQTSIAVDTYNGTVQGDVTVTLTTTGGGVATGPSVMQLKSTIGWDAELNAKEELMGTFVRGGQGGRSDGVMHNMAVRRLTPIECERLQGFPDNYTNIKDKCPDGNRYKALGNSMAVPVMRWIGERINFVETNQLLKEI